MRFLVVSKKNKALPTEEANKLMEATKQWAGKNKTYGKFEQVWSFAGIRGMGLIINVSSLEELDSVMNQYPLVEYYDIEIYALTDMDIILPEGFQEKERFHTLEFERSKNIPGAKFLPPVM